LESLNWKKKGLISRFLVLEGRKFSPNSLNGKGISLKTQFQGINYQAGSPFPGEFPRFGTKELIKGTKFLPLISGNGKLGIITFPQWKERRENPNVNSLKFLIQVEEWLIWKSQGSKSNKSNLSPNKVPI